MGFYIGGPDFDGVETGNRVSVGSGGHLGELVGPLISIDAGGLSKSSKVALGCQTWLITSGSPHDLTLHPCEFTCTLQP